VVYTAALPIGITHGEKARESHIQEFAEIGAAEIRRIAAEKD
jgi:hypothetical protein